MKWSILALLATAMLTTTGVALADSFVGYVPGRLIIEMTEDTYPAVDKSGGALNIDLPELNAMARNYRATELIQLYPAAKPPTKAGRTNLLRHYILHFPDEVSLDAISADMLKLSSVTRVWKDELRRMTSVPNDPLLSSQWWLRNTNLGGTDIRTVGGWAEATGDSNIVIAIVDSGVDWNHPDLGGTHPDRINGAIFTNWPEYYGVPGLDDDGNGRVDDVHGWDFINLSQSAGYPDEDMTTPDNDPSDYESHGTACAGCAAAMTNNGIGVAGVAGGCKILPVRAGYLPAGETGGVVVLSYASSGMIYAANTGANIVNCSWGSSSFLSFAVDYCVDAGMIIVNAAGNDNDQIPEYLGTHPDVLSVAATGDGDGKASFSNYGTWVELAAPGVNITTTWYDRFSDTSTYGSTQGTSFSAPITCGALALIWSAHPTWDRTQVTNLLLSSCDNINAVNPAYAGLLGAGRINLLRALGDNFLEIGTEFEYQIDAFNEAADGDTIAFMATENLIGPMIVPAKDLHVLGGWDAGFTSRNAIASPTVITANPANTALQVQGGAGPGTVIDGFRCIGGGGKTFSGIPLTGKFGGGMIINATSPTLRNIEVTGNTTGSSTSIGGGGGVLLLNSDAILDNVNIHGNTSLYGAGVFISGGAPTLRNSQIVDNVIITDNLVQTPLGGGIYVVDADLTIENCTISGHDNVDMGGGIYAYQSTGSVSLNLSHNQISDNNAKTKGGGLYLNTGSLVMLGDVVSQNNPTGDAVFMSGGGICIENATADLDSLVVSQNTSQTGGGIYFDGGSSFDLDDSVVHSNTALFFAGAISLQNAASSDMTGNTIAANGAPSASGGVYLFNASTSLNNNIVAYNTGLGSAANGINVVSSSPSFSCNDVFGNDGIQYGGVTDPTGTGGNISLDPKFCDIVLMDFALFDTSPCHVGNAGACGQIGALGQGCSEGTGIDDPGVIALPLVFSVDPNYPNPFNPTTTIRFTLPANGDVTIRIYDVAGRVVRTLVNERLEARIHEVTWSGRNDQGQVVSSGVYFYRIETDTDVFVDRMALLK